MKVHLLAGALNQSLMKLQRDVRSSLLLIFKKTEPQSRKQEPVVSKLGKDDQHTEMIVSSTCEISLCHGLSAGRDTQLETQTALLQEMLNYTKTQNTR